MNNWKILNEKEYKRVWDTFEKVFSFLPSVHEKDWPSITSDMPFCKLDISSYSAKTEDVEKKIENIALGIFKKITEPNEKMYGLVILGRNQ